MFFNTTLIKRITIDSLYYYNYLFDFFFIEFRITKVFFIEVHVLFEVLTLNIYAEVSMRQAYLSYVVKLILNIICLYCTMRLLFSLFALRI